MKKRILSILLLCCMVLTMMPATVFAADGEVAARASETGGLYEHHEVCGADPAGAADTMMPKTRSGAVRPAATQYTYTLHYDANGGSGAPPSESKISSEYQASFLISDKIPTRDGYTFKGWADSPYGKPIYLRADGYYWYCNVVNGQTNSKTLYAVWEVHNHNWGEWTSNGNGTHTRTCNADSSHTETGNCSGGKATSTEKAVCETCHTAYGALLQPAKTVITTPPTLRLPAYVGNEYTDRALMGGEAKAEGTDIVVPGSFGFRDYEGGRVHPGENHMVILFTPNDTEAYTTAECILTVTGTKRTITRVPDDVIITDKPIGTAFEDLGLPLSPFGVKVETNTGASYSPVPVTWDGSAYDPNKYGEQIITGELHVEKSGFTDGLEPTNTVKATARITLIDDRVFTPTLEPPTYSKQLYGGDLCFLVFADKYLSGGTATVNGETVSGKFTLDKDQKIYGHSLTASTLLQAGQLQLKIIFTPDNLKRYNKAKCTVDVNVVPRTFKETRAGHITNEKFGTPFEELNLSDSFSFYAVGDEKDPEGTGMDFGMNVVTSWDSSTYDPNSFEEQTIYGEVNRAELEKYFTIPDGTDLRAVRKVQLQPDPVETEITQLPVFRWKNGDFTLPDNTIFTWRKLQVGTYNGEVGTLVGEGTEVFTVMAVNDLGEDIKEFSITIAKAPETEYAVTVRDDGHGTGSADPASATAGTEITLTATPNAGYHFKEWQVMSGDVTVRDDKFTMPSDNVEIKVIFEEDATPTPTEYTVTVKTDGNGTASASHAKAVVGTEITLTATPNAGYHFKEWQVMSGDVTVRDDKFTMPGSDVEVKAIFEEDVPPTPTEYTVTFDGNDGTPSVGSMTTTKQKLISLPDASRSKHSFNGWYTEKSGGTKITTDTVFSANTTVYAHWTHTGDNNPPVNYYTLRFETGGGSAIPDVRETYNTYMDLTNYVPTRHGYTFVGWYSEQSLVNKVSDIYLTGDRIVYAGWRAVTIPQTGDSGQMNLWSTALCASFAGCVALIVWKIRRREKKSL